jgi:hypothetical protein
MPKKKIDTRSHIQLAHDSLFNFGWNGATAKRKDATKILAPLSNEELETLFKQFADDYAANAGNVESELDDDTTLAGYCGDGDAVCAIENMTDALRCRWAISDEYDRRILAAKKSATKPAKKLRLVA